MIDVYDVFGLAPQTIQGADRLSGYLNALVLLPDFFEGDVMDEAWFPPDTDDKKAKMARFRAERANLDVVKKLVEVRKELGEKWPAVDDHVGAFGLCFGGECCFEGSLNGWLEGRCADIESQAKSVSQRQMKTTWALCGGSTSPERHTQGKSPGMFDNLGLEC